MISINKLPRARVVFFFFFFWEKGASGPYVANLRKRRNQGWRSIPLFSLFFSRDSFHRSRRSNAFLGCKLWNTKRVYNICYILEAEERVRRSFFSLSRRYVVYRVPNLVIQSAVAVLRINFILTVVIYNILHAVTRVQRQIYVRTQKMHTNTFKLVHEHAV